MPRFNVTFLSEDESNGIDGEFEAANEFLAVEAARDRWHIPEGSPDFPNWTVLPA